MDGNITQTSKSLRKYLSQHPRVVLELIDVLAMYGDIHQTQAWKGAYMHLYLTGLVNRAVVWDHNRMWFPRWVKKILTNKKGG